MNKWAEYYLLRVNNKSYFGHFSQKSFWKTLCLEIFNTVNYLCISKQDLYFYINKNNTLK